jgi:hypothetical protein
VDVRIECVKEAKHFLLHHPELTSDITGDNLSSLSNKGRVHNNDNDDDDSL